MFFVSIPGPWSGGTMDVLYPYCAGIDVHKKTISVCVLTPGAPSKPQQQVREYGTTTRELLELADWLFQNQVTQIGMESTGVYWKPIWNILEAAGFCLTLANAQQVKNVPGKKTDTAECVSCANGPQWRIAFRKYSKTPTSSSATW
jgi:transposase